MVKVKISESVPFLDNVLYVWSVRARVYYNGRTSANIRTNQCCGQPYGLTLWPSRQLEYTVAETAGISAL